MQKRIERIFINLFGLPAEKCADTLSPQDVDAWNSIQHLTLVMALEEEFGVQFAPEEISEMTSIGAIKARLGQHGVS